MLVFAFRFSLYSQVNDGRTQIRNAKYKRAILQAKLANLQKVSLRQEKLLQEVNNLAEQKNQVSFSFTLFGFVIELFSNFRNQMNTKSLNELDN